VHCAALAPTLLESELFGHEKGAFTGAHERRIGRFEEANGGSLFLDEIGEIDASTQVKLLRFLGERTFERVGSNKTVSSDVRLITATNKNLAEMVRASTFREDLYFRLKVVEIKLPPLRERRSDVPLMANAFLREFAKANQKSVKAIAPEAMEVLMKYPWPGNVRELRAAIEGAVVLCRGDKVQPHDLPDEVRSGNVAAGVGPLGVVLPAETVKDAEKQLIIRALKEADGNRTVAAKRIGMSRRTLHRKAVDVVMRHAADGAPFALMLRSYAFTQLFAESESTAPHPLENLVVDGLKGTGIGFVQIQIDDQGVGNDLYRSALSTDLRVHAPALFIASDEPDDALCNHYGYGYNRYHNGFYGGFFGFPSYWGWGGYPYYGLGGGYYPYYNDSYSYPYYSDSGYNYAPDYSSSAPSYSSAPLGDVNTTTTAPAPQSTINDNAVLIGVRVPENAEVWIDGQKTSQTGSFREFATPPLESGQKFIYDIKARWTENGKEVVRDRQLNFYAGDRLMVNMMVPAQQSPAQALPAPRQAPPAPRQVPPPPTP